jgi:hypothetical protein
MTYIDNLDRLHARVIANVWLQLFTGIVRVLLAIGFILPGMTKVLGNRFTSLPVTTPVGSFFDAFFQAHEYYIFVGTAQVLAGILLLFRRTTTLGAVLYLPIILNIFVITVSIGFALTEMITGLMTLANVYLLCWDYDRWKGLLPVEASESRHVGMAVLFSLFDRRSFRLPWSHATPSRIVEARNTDSSDHADAGRRRRGTGCSMAAPQTIFPLMGLFRRHRFACHPRCDLFPRPAMVIIQVNDDNGQSQFLLATLNRTLTNRPLKTIEEPVEVLRRIRLSDLRRQSVHTVVRSAQRAGCIPAFEVIAICLFRASECTRSDKCGEFLFAVDIPFCHMPSLMTSPENTPSL